MVCDAIEGIETVEGFCWFDLDKRFKWKIEKIKSSKSMSADELAF